jgi:kumamolisin
VGGTSAAAPLWAGIAAVGNQMAGKALGFITPALYKVAASDNGKQAFRDITSGNNSQGGVPGYDADGGWDPVTGLGAPRADKLLPELIATLGA